jgi:deoxycytidylate deaminase
MVGINMKHNSDDDSPIEHLEEIALLPKSSHTEKRIPVPFLIIGLTGPMSSGCTELASWIEREDVSTYIEKERLVTNIQEKIKKAYQCIDKIKKIKNTEITEAETNTELLKQNSQLKDFIKLRSCYTVIKTINSPFKRISLSSLILKIAVEQVKTKEFSKWKNDHQHIAKKLEETSEKYNSTLNKYNRKKAESTFISLTPNEIEEIDLMIKAFEDLKDNIKQIEANLHFNGKIDRLYLQDFGDNIRRSGNAFTDRTFLEGSSISHVQYIAEEANRLIKYYRNRKVGRFNCFVIDAFRNPYEVDYFRRYDAFYLVSLTTLKGIREQRMITQLENNSVVFDKSKFQPLFDAIEERDLGTHLRTEDQHRQNVSKCCEIADISLTSDKSTEDLYRGFLKYLALMAKPGYTQPTKEETLMHLAYSLSLRSTCISRQVGAVITDQVGYILGLGWNDVGSGQIGCGLKNKTEFLDLLTTLPKRISETVNTETLEQYKDEDSVCFKDVVSVSEIKNRLQKELDKQIDKLGQNKIKISQSEKNSLIRNTVETVKVKMQQYCRALHAEENAILQTAIRGGMGIKEGIIYTTTFPCELCSKKIYQAGISQIIYTEPYPDSLSLDLVLSAGTHRVKIQQFEGVMSHGYYRLYKSIWPKKDMQEMQSIEIH